MISITAIEEKLHPVIANRLFVFDMDGALLIKTTACIEIAKISGTLDQLHCVAFGDSMSDYPLFQELVHTVSINGDETLKSLARYHYEGSDLHEAFLNVCNAQTIKPTVRNPDSEREA
jgi:phosphoserine phosphatase